MFMMAYVICDDSTCQDKYHRWVVEGLRRGFDGMVALGWVDGTRFAFPSYGGFFGRLKGLFLRLDLAVAGRRAEGLSRSAAGDRTLRRAASLTGPSAVAGWGGPRGPHVVGRRAWGEK